MTVSRVEEKDNMVEPEEFKEEFANSSPPDDITAAPRDWTDAEERKATWKLDLILLVPLMLGFFALQLDKTNISSAITTNFVHDIGITNDIVNAGNQLQFAAIVIFEIPSNMILSRIGAPLWLTIECFSWGMIATFQAWIHNQSSFYATRFLLGTFEGGYLAGCLLVIGTFYTKKETAMRMTVLYSSNYLAAGTSSLIAAGIFNLHEVGGLKDWQWLFVIDGAFTVMVAFVFAFTLPRKTTYTRPLVPLRFLDVFTDRDRDILRRRMVLEDRARSKDITSIGIKEVFKHLTTNHLIWGHSLVALIALTPKGGLLLYAPTIIKNLGFDKITANLLAAVSNFALIALSILAARISDWTRLRGPVCFACTVYALVFAGVQYAVTPSDDKWLKYGIFVVFMAGNATFQGINSAWMSTNLRDPTALGIGQAVIVMATNCGGLIGQQIFRDDDAPRYTRGFLTIMCLYGGTMIMIVGLTYLYWRKNRNMVRLTAGTTGEEEGGNGQTEEERRFEI